MRDLLPPHLLVDRVGALDAALHARGNALAPQFASTVCRISARNSSLECRCASMAPQDLLVGLRLQVLEREVLQLAAHFAHAEPVRDGRVDLDGLLRDALLPLRGQVAQRAHVVQAVGQLHHDDADVVHHRQQHLADALGLALLGGEEIELGQLGDAVHAARHFVAELLADLLDGDAGVLDHVVQQARSRWLTRSIRMSARIMRHRERDGPCRARRNRASGPRGTRRRSGRPSRAAARSSLGRYSRTLASSSR